MRHSGSSDKVVTKDRQRGRVLIDQNPQDAATDVFAVEDGREKGVKDGFHVFALCKWLFGVTYAMRSMLGGVECELCFGKC